VYAGNQTFISCAEEIKRYDECSQLAICVTNGTTDYEYIANHFSSDFLVMSESPRESISLYNDGKCNVIAHGRLGLINFMFREGDLMHPSFAIGNKTFNNDPLAFVTRPDDYEWSNVVNYALQALFYGERHGIGKNEEMCDNRTDDLSSNWNELHYLNAVYCVGNYTEIYSNSQFADFTRTAINTINEGTPMLYVIPYGNLDNTHNEMFFDLSATFARIKRQTNVNCGILVQESHNGNSTFEGSFGMATDYCQTLASSMLDGNNFAVNYTTFYNEERSITALKNEEVDVLFGLAAEMTHNFDEVAFSTPYYYGNQTGK
jgi:ABC-type amino acid transport substrate-binding protein